MEYHFNKIETMIFFSCSLFGVWPGRMDAQLAYAGTGVNPLVIPDVSNEMTYNNWLIVLGVVVLFIALLLVSVGFDLYQRRKKQYNLVRFGSNCKVKNLFLGVSYEVLEGSETKRAGFLRELSMTKALLVTEQKLKKGERLSLFLDTLPGFPNRHSYVKGSVTSCEQIPNETGKYLVRVSFNPEKDKIAQSLGKYLHHLKAPFRLNHV